jgi:hypothetical protein
MGKSRLSLLHVIFWLLKDTFWCLQFTAGAVTMLIPTLALTIYILFKETENRAENFILSSWILMNCFWMSHELLNTPYWLVYPPMLIGISFMFKLIVNKSLIN